MDTIKCRVVVEKVWDATKNRYALTGEVLEFPAQVKDHTGKLLPFKVGESYKVVDEKPARGRKADEPESLT